MILLSIGRGNLGGDLLPDEYAQLAYNMIIPPDYNQRKPAHPPRLLRESDPLPIGIA